MRKLILFFETRKRLTFFLALVWSIVIFIGCSMPGRELPKIGIFDHIDKVIHFIFFAVFFGLWFLSTPKTAASVLFLLVISIIYGFGLEFYQLHYVAGRSFDVWDGVADTVGALCGWGVMWYSKIVESRK
ncbi:MAG: VanZ family protein [Bacteroidetes bacterium]|jgi:VanZ family protein|nr:VanZ family protein [Bacteroidota bacterium]MBK8329503.1 VanZ family protein [Bacteroidota bacterium]MBK9481249.1 VanZ family protein [Bacteroidota bacterium]